MPVRLPRWTWLVVLATLVGGLLWMHGLDAQAGDAHPGAPAAASVVTEHSHHASTPADHGHCLDCTAGHVMVVCVAILTALGGIAFARRLVARARPAALVAAGAGRLRGLVELARPPDPAWVRLSVMRC